MGIYTRDNINYGGMLGAALQNKARLIERDYDNYMKQPLAWSNAVANSGKIAQDAMFKMASNYYDQDKIAQQQQFQASEAEKRALEALERQKQQEEFQKVQNELNRKNTYDIALLNKSTVADEKKDEYQLYYQRAKAALALAQAEYDKNKNSDKHKKAVEDAQFDVDYWAKKAGANVAATQPTPPKGDTPVFGEDFLNEIGYKAEQPKPEDTFDNADIKANLDVLLEGDWTNDKKAKAQDLVSKIGDPSLKSQYEQKIKDKLYTVEERQARAAAELKNANNEWLRTGDYDSEKYKIVYEGPGNAHLVRK